MIRNKISRILLSMLIIIITVLGMCANAVKAVDTSTETIKLGYYRYILNDNGWYTSSGYGYGIHRTGANTTKPIFQILSVDGNSRVVDGNLYCVSADEGRTWNSDNISTPITYNRGYDLVKEKSEISNLSNTYKSILSDDVYIPVMWILDNMYTDDSSMTVAEFLNTIGIEREWYGTNAETGEKIYRYFYNYDGRSDKGTTLPFTNELVIYDHAKTTQVEGYSVLLSKELIQAVQQSAIWYFTDYIGKGNSVYNNYEDIAGDGITKHWLKYTLETDSSRTYNLLHDAGSTEAERKNNRDLQEQASILYNYLVDSAKLAKKYNYTTSSEGTISLSYTSDKRIEKEGSNYKIGPIKIETTGTVTNLGYEVTTGTNYTTTINKSNITLKDKDNKTISSITANKEFYVIVPQSVVNDGVKIKVTGKTASTSKMLFSDQIGEEQPIVKVKKTEKPIETDIVATLEKPFDLALRKQIIAINGVSTGIVNEDEMDATRKMNITTSSIPETATYKHRKDPVVVKTNDIVTYKISIYNEGEIDGYASTIVDQLPANMEIDSSMENTVTSEKGNIYTITKNNNKITLALTGSGTGTVNSISAYNNGTLDEDSVEIKCKVTQKAEVNGKTKHYLTNIAYIGEARDKNGQIVERDRENTESTPNNTTIPSNLNETDSSKIYKGNNSNNSVYDDTNNTYFYKGQEDDDDFETVVVLPERFDLALRKFITKVSPDGDFASAGTKTYNRAPQVDTTKLNTKDANGKPIATWTYNHTKEPVGVDVGDYVLYTIKVYNEGDLAGRAAEITDYLPKYLDFVESTDEYINSINSKWTYDPVTKKVTTTQLAGTVLKKFDATADKGHGEGLDSADVQIICKVNNNAIEEKKITNIAEITKYADEDGNELGKNVDIDSDANNLEYPDDESRYKDEEINRGDEYIPGQEDDDDFEKVVVRKPGEYNIVLVKQDENGEQLDSVAKFKVATGEQNVDEAEEKEVTGKLTIAEKVTIDKTNVSTQDIYKIKETVAPDGYCEFDGTIIVTVNKGLSETGKYEVTGIEYKVVNDNGEEFKTEDVKVYVNEDGNIYVEVKDYEEDVFDLALRKFITDISGKEVTTRIPQVSYKDNKITYEHPKDVLKVAVGDVVTYTLRVYNEGGINGFAQTITDDIPEFLEYLPDNKTNKEYRWKMYDKDGNETDKVKDAVKIVTDYTSKENGEKLMKDGEENPNLLKAFDPKAKISDKNPNYVDVKVAFKVLDPNSNKEVITNKAQISDDADENGNEVKDIDSEPDKWNEGEDDQDYENVSVEYFDLALLKYVTEVIVTEKGTTTTTKTGNTGADSDIVPKVEVNKHRLNSTVVKFGYTIKITNEGDVEGYAKEITDYVPEGLKFYAEDNKGWKDEGNNVISTKLLEDKLLKPGESATVKVVLRWINGANNLGIKTNIAEISKDYNEKGIPDRDSTPDNKKDGEDDIDDAPVLLAIATGIIGTVMPYIGGALLILVVLAGGIIIIKKYVL